MQTTVDFVNTKGLSQTELHSRKPDRIQKQSPGLIFERFGYLLSKCLQIIIFKYFHLAFAIWCQKQDRNDDHSTIISWPNVIQIVPFQALIREGKKSGYCIN